MYVGNCHNLTQQYVNLWNCTTKFLVNKIMKLPTATQQKVEITCVQMARHGAFYELFGLE